MLLPMTNIDIMYTFFYSMKLQNRFLLYFSSDHLEAANSSGILKTRGGKILSNIEKCRNLFSLYG